METVMTTAIATAEVVTVMVTGTAAPDTVSFFGGVALTAVLLGWGAAFARLVWALDRSDRGSYDVGSLPVDPPR